MQVKWSGWPRRDLRPGARRPVQNIVLSFAEASGMTWRHFPVFDDLAVVVEAEDVDPRGSRGRRAMLEAVQHDVVGFCDRPFGLDRLPGYSVAMRSK